MRDELQKLLASYQLHTECVKQEKRVVGELEQEVKDTLEAQQIIQSVAEAVQKEAHRRVAGIVTRCLKAVFEEDAYEFHINFVQRRGKTEADFVLRRDGMELSPLDETGGGVCDVVAFALRVAALVLTRPRKRLFLALDEPMKMLSSHYRERMALLLEQLAEELEIQFLIITHHPEFQIGTVIEL